MSVTENMKVMADIVNPANPTLELVVRVSIAPDADDDGDPNLWSAACSVMLGNRYWMSESKADIQYQEIGGFSLALLLDEAMKNALKDIAKDRKEQKK